MLDWRGTQTATLGQQCRLHLQAPRVAAAPPVRAAAAAAATSCYHRRQAPCPTITQAAGVHVGATASWGRRLGSSSSSSSSSTNHCVGPSWSQPTSSSSSPRSRSRLGRVASAQQGNLNMSDPNSLANMFMAYALQMQQALEQQQQAAVAVPQGANVLLQDLTFHPPGAEKPLLSGVNMHLAANQLGLVIGRSGSGKTTLLQLLAGLTDQTSGAVYISQQQLVQMVAGAGASSSNGDGGGVGCAPLPALPPALTLEQRMGKVGLVFQFPERHFLGDDLVSELTFAWPRTLEAWAERAALAARLEKVMQAVGLTGVPLHIPPTALSGGQQRRLALAIQLVRQPALLLLDEPLAGLDWQARAEVVGLLRALKQQATLLVVSHDLREISPLVDVAWRMEMGGRLEPVAWPPDSMSDLED